MPESTSAPGCVEYAAQNDQGSCDIAGALGASVSLEERAGWFWFLLLVAAIVARAELHEVDVLDFFPIGPLGHMRNLFGHHFLPDTYTQHSHECLLAPYHGILGLSLELYPRVGNAV